eukprot:g7766.t1
MRKVEPSRTINTDDGETTPGTRTAVAPSTSSPSTILYSGFRSWFFGAPYGANFYFDRGTYENVVVVAEKRSCNATSENLVEKCRVWDENVVDALLDLGGPSGKRNKVKPKPKVAGNKAKLNLGMGGPAPALMENKAAASSPRAGHQIIRPKVEQPTVVTRQHNLNVNLKL